MRSAILLCAVTSIGLGCAHATPPPLHRVPLEVDRSCGTYRPFVRVKVAGQPMRLLVDTGAFRSALPATVARARHLRSASSAHDERIVDAAGNRVVVSLLPAVPVQFEGEAGPARLDFLSIPGSVGEGILAPRDLVSPGWALVLDLEHEELRYEPEDSAVQRLGGGGPAPSRTEFRTCLNEGLFNTYHRYVAASINGTPASMMLDTGAAQTLLWRNNPAIPSMRAMLGERGELSALTSRGRGLAVDGVEIGFAGTVYPVTAVVVPVSSACSGGAIGADVLQHCTIVWGHASMWMSCRAPDGRP